MNLDRWRGKPGVMGWVTRKWDVYQFQRLARRLQDLNEEQYNTRMSEHWRKEQIYRNGATKKDEPL